ncbi:hypothetical protein E2C01_049742 [Portunus trituberculatus]|uniref:Uncharacterized protein n=1 Tax=Portunus trituberculatus TaxID=210409 RepID=A0A5B7GF60_PORTR|nr:hypothetical protein [Portunus trituberculatus]
MTSAVAAPNFNPPLSGGGEEEVEEEEEEEEDLFSLTSVAPATSPVSHQVGWTPWRGAGAGLCDVTCQKTLTQTRSVATNLQYFADTVLIHPCIKCDVSGLTETRLDSDLSPVYQLLDYSLFTKSRNKR